ncbi:MAG TPA: twin-arginine translocase subunit TatC [Oculatellaceae cyanobacterium]
MTTPPDPSGPNASDSLKQQETPLHFGTESPRDSLDLQPVDEKVDSTPSYTSPEPSERTDSEGGGITQEQLQAGMMTVVEHLDELRTRLFRCIGYVALGCVAALFLTKEIIRLLEAPAGNISFQALSLEEPVLVFFKVAFYAGLILSSPLILFEIAGFVAPGLTKKERQVVTPIVIGSPILFVCGGLFAYFCLLHPMLHFFGAFGAGVAPINQRLDFYISLVSSILLYMGLCFQLPIIIFALSFTGLVNSTMLIRVWRYAVLAASLAAAVITPDPTAISMLIVMAALIGLYFLSVLLLKLVGR